MELVVLGLIVVFIYAFIRVLASFNTWMTGTRYRAYRQLAHRHGGRYESRGMSGSRGTGSDHSRSANEPTYSGRRAVSVGNPVPARACSGFPSCPNPAAQGNTNGQDG